MTRPLFVAALRLERFRNHAATALTLDDRPVCLFGPNGAGKTNLIEALAGLAPGRGLRGAAALELAQGGPEAAAARARAWAISAELAVGGDRRIVGQGLDRAPDGGWRRLVRLDGEPATAAAIAELVRIAWVTPAMDRLFAGPPADRRRFLDRLALAFAPSHAVAAAAYERAMRERTRLLLEGRADPAWLAALEREMAAAGVRVARARAQTLAALSQAIAAQGGGCFPKALLSLADDLDTVAETDPAEAFARRLARGRARDAAAGRALEGPHRADLLVRHAAKDMPAELCSTGEQKALLLGLLLAHARALAADAAAGPTLLLLDEAAAHLDPDRRASLFDELLTLPGQTWLTGTEPALFEAFADRAQRFAVADGAVAPA